ncbi:MAG: citrate/2-methylcitrate synthase [Phycisphaerae bacterium]|jgi:succinyl-CoA synthetase alpha subunit|nr:citrate/2-methylcitrate synthase [Phycisphaerae bacterium]
MRAAKLSDLLQAGDRIAVSNITGREARNVTVASQKYCGNIVGGWALGKGGRTIDVPGQDPIPVYSTVEELMGSLPKNKRPNKVIVYSPPAAVYGDVKGVVEHRNGSIKTIFIITENVSIEVSSRISQLCHEANIDVLGCNSLGVINAHDAVRAGAVGGDTPATSFTAGSTTIISNSGNMVNTMASYLANAGLGTSFGISTGKDVLILTPLKDLVDLAVKDDKTEIIVLYVEPGGLYEKEAVEMLRQCKSVKPIIAYVTGGILATKDLSLGHAGAVVDGGQTTAAAKMELFDNYFGIGPFEPGRRYHKTAELIDSLGRGMRITTLHHLPAAAGLICDRLGIQRDFRRPKQFRLNPWFVDYKHLGKTLPTRLLLHAGVVPKPYASQFKALMRTTLGAAPGRRDMRNASRVSSNDGKETRIYGLSLAELMRQGSFASSLILSWTGEKPRDFEAVLVEKCLIAALSNGPGTISAQGAKLSAAAGNAPNTAMIASLASIGQVHGGNGRRAVEYLLKVFRDIELDDPFDPKHGLDLAALAKKEVKRFAKIRKEAKDAGSEYDRIPCLGHPVFNTEAVNYDPRERAIAECLTENEICNVFLDYYHLLTVGLKEAEIARNVWAVNLDGAIASVTLGICWRALKERRMTVQRACDIAFLMFAVGRAAGSAGEFLDHQDYGSPMDMRIPVSECISLTRPRD